MASGGKAPDRVAVVARHFSDAMRGLREARELAQLLAVDASNPGGEVEIDYMTVLDMMCDRLRVAVAAFSWRFEGPLVNKLAAFTVEHFGFDGLIADMETQR